MLLVGRFCLFVCKITRKGYGQMLMNVSEMFTMAQGTDDVILVIA